MCCTRALPIVFILFIFGLASLDAAEPGFSPLFNGKDLKGWFTIGHREALAVTETGDLVNDTGKSVFLVTEQDYSDFILRFRVKYDKLPKDSGWDRGVLFRSKPIWSMYSGDDGKAVRKEMSNLEGPLMATYPKPDMRGVIIWCGAGFKEKPDPQAIKVALNPDPSGWNHYEIAVVGRKTVIRINGVKVIDKHVKYDVESIKWGFTKIAFRIGRKVRYRDIRIKDLTKTLRK